MPIEFLIKQKRLNFLHYILNEDISSITHQVYVALKEDNRKGDFVHLTNCDRRDLEIDLSDTEIKDMSKNMWKKYVKETVKNAAFKCLVDENNTKEKTKGIKFSSLDLSEYLRKNMKKSVSQIIFSTRSKKLK